MLDLINIKTTRDKNLVHLVIGFVIRIQFDSGVNHRPRVNRSTLLSIKIHQIHDAILHLNVSNHGRQDREAAHAGADAARGGGVGSGGHWVGCFGTPLVWGRIGQWEPASGQFDQLAQPP